MSEFTCPKCGSHEWGSAYNFDGLGDIAPHLPGLDSGARSTRYEGTFTRSCHGHGCNYQWNSRDDLANGIEQPQGSIVVGRR